MGKLKFERPEIFICECGSLEHSYAFWYDEETKDIHFMPHLISYRNFFKRIWVAIKYIFGYQCRYGHFDSMIINPEDIKKLRGYFDRSEVEVFLDYHPEIREKGLECFGDFERLSNWLLSKTAHFHNERVIDQPENEILMEIGRIEHGIF